jgi:Xaa-Pro aminopeptidase
MKNRVDRAQTLIRKRGLDSILISGEENFQYFTGVSGTICLHYSATRPAVVVVPVEGEPIAIVGTATESVVRSALNDVRSYNSTTGVPPELYVDVLKDAGLSRGKVGLEQGLEMRIGQPIGDLLALFRSLPDVSFVDVASLIWELRMTKSKEELELMKKAAVVTGKARQKMFDECHEGMTHREIARLFSELMLHYGADRVAFVHIGTKEPLNLTQFHSDRQITKGDTLYVDGGAYVRSHTIDYPRMGTVGKPSSKQIGHHKAIQRICEKMVGAVKPGKTCREVWKVGHRAIRDAGFAALDVGRLGHGQGMLSTEPPSISSGDGTVLKPGMVIGVEPFSTTENVPMIWEDVYAVSEDAHQRLTFESDELRVIR